MHGGTTGGIWGGVPAQAALGLSERQLLLGTGVTVIVFAVLIIYTGYRHPRWTGFAPGEEWESQPEEAAAKARRYAIIYGAAFVVLGLVFVLAGLVR